MGVICIIVSFLVLNLVVRFWLVLVSVNLDKVVEIIEVFGGLVDLDFRLVDLFDVVEDGDTFEANVCLKVVVVCEVIGCVVVVDDTGLEVDVFGGVFGVHFVCFVGNDVLYVDNLNCFFSELEGIFDGYWTVRFKIVVFVYYLDGWEVFVIGTVEGVIFGEFFGEGGFGYDLVFVFVEGDGSIFVEMGETKYVLFYWGWAFRVLVRVLGVGL